MLFQCWSMVETGGPTLKKHCVNASCLLGYAVQRNRQKPIHVECSEIEFNVRNSNPVK